MKRSILGILKERRAFNLGDGKFSGIPKFEMNGVTGNARGKSGRSIFRMSRDGKFSGFPKMTSFGNFETPNF